MSKTFTQLFNTNPLTVGNNTVLGGDNSAITGGFEMQDVKNYLKSTFPEYGAGFGGDNRLCRTQGTGSIVAASTRVTLDDSGNMGGVGTIDLTGGQIAFPATQLSSADANTLDDYEQGSFTPSLGRFTTNPTISSYVTQQGEYTKIGNLVTINISIIYNGSNLTVAGSGPNIISGLPFSSSVTYSAGVVAYNDVFSVTPVKSVTISGSTLFFNTATTPSQGNVNENYNSVAGNHYLGIQITYIAI